MAYIFGDGFDLYATTADLALNYWDSANSGSNLITNLATGRFAGSRALQFNNSGTASALVKSSNVNDAVHHIICAFNQNAAISGSTFGIYFQLSDGATNQVCINFRSDGAIILTSATPGGTVLDTYTGAVTASNTWVAFEFEVVINNTTGSWAVRKNGNTSNDHALGSLNTRPGTNNYANKLTVGTQTSPYNSSFLDDLLWRSDAASVPWVGDIRCYTRMPASDVSTQFASIGSVTASTGGNSGPQTYGANVDAYSWFVAPRTGVVTSLILPLNAGGTGHIKAALFGGTAANNGSLPTTLLGTANVLTNPIAGNNTITFPTPVPVTINGNYMIGFNQDTSINYQTTIGIAAAMFGTQTYAAFPTANPPVGPANQRTVCTVVMTGNAVMVNEVQQDGTATYVGDNNPGDADFYTLASTGSTPAVTVAVVTRGLMQKGDAGLRTAAVQLKSGSTTVASPALALASGFQWVYRTDTVDPATGAAWTAAAVNAATIGPVVVS